MTYKSFITTLMAGAIAITGMTAAPAKADNTAQIIAGAAALAIVGIAISESNKPDHVYVTRNRGHHGYAPRRHRAAGAMKKQVFATRARREAIF